MADRRDVPRELALIGVFSWFFFFYGLAALGLLGADESRYAQVAREMLERGDWVTPTLYSTVWLEKPILYYWSAMLSYRGFGVSDWAARFPAAVFATGMVAVIYLFVRRFRPGAQMDATLMTITSAGILGFARGASTDMPLAACFSIGLLGWWAWFQTQRKKWLLGFYLFMAGGALAKGPVAPVLIALIIVAFALVRRDQRLILRTLWVPGVLLFLGVTLPWYWMVQSRNPQFFHEFFLQHNLGRFTTNLYRHPHPFWYYIPVLLLGLFPWTVFAVHGFTDSVKRARREERSVPDGSLRLFLVIWAAVPVIFFSFSQSKLPGYILPAIPAWSLLASDYLFRKRDASASVDRIASIPHALFVATVAGVVMLSPHLLLDRHAALPRRALATAVFVGIAVFVCLFAGAHRRGWQILRSATLVPTILLTGFVLKVAAPVVDVTQSARPVARDLARPGFSGLPIVIQDVPRSLEYGLAFYRNAPVYKREDASNLGPRYLIVEPAGSKAEWAWAVDAGGFAPQRLRYLLVVKHFSADLPEAPR